ncbi:TPA: hypothetical protein ACS72N_000153 [Providencia alcalifaciens]
MSQNNNVDATIKFRYAKVLLKRLPMAIFVVILAPLDSGDYDMFSELPECNSAKVLNTLNKMVSPHIKIKNPEQYYLDPDGLTRFCRVTLNDSIYSYTVNWYSEKKDKIIVSFE